MANTLDLSARLATARLKDNRGTGALDVFALAAFAVTSWVAFVVASGTWMFVQRHEHPLPWLVAASPYGTENVTQTYVVLAGFACAVLILPILGLGGAAARLGARGRARRLASLRLIGMTSTEVVGMSVVESLIQAAAGLVLGVGLWLASTPLLGLLSFQRQHLGFSELLMPWWLWLAVAAAVLLLAALSTIGGLTRVRISPLGVARQTSSAPLRAWRLGALAGGIAVILSLGTVLDLPLGGMVVGLVFAGVLAFGIFLTNLFAPFLLQLVGRVGVRTESPARLIAMRRIVADPRSAWRNVSSLGLIGFIVGLLSTIPLGSFDDLDEIGRMQWSDVRAGAWLTFGIALVLGATATALTQSSDVVDRADELVALDRMGVSPQVDAAARRHQVLLPLTATLVTSMGLGVLAALPLVGVLEGALGMGAASVLVLGGSLLIALVLSLIAAESTRPLRARVLGSVTRRND